MTIIISAPLSSPWRRARGALALTLALLATVTTSTSFPSENARAESAIRVAEMSEDLTVFEVFLPLREANRKGVVHEVYDDTGAVISTQKFGTANGHYNIAMIASYYNGREYKLVIDRTYQLKFTYQAAD
jgi:hypothetical protein